MLSPKRAHLSGDYFILEKDGIPIAGIMAADELEDYLELQDPKVKRAISQSNADIKAGRTKLAQTLLLDAMGKKSGTPNRRRK